MKNVLRNAVLVAGASATMFLPGSASATSAAQFTGTATIGCFGCGTYGPAGNSATFCVNGVVNNVNVTCVPGTTNGTATFTVTEPVGATCVVSGTATGTITVTGVGSAGFTWNRTGPHARVTVSAWGSTAEVVFNVTSPVGNPCGGPVTAVFSGTLTGA